MSNFELMNSIQAFKQLNKGIPHILLCEMMTFSLILKYFFQQISTVRIFHDNTS